MTSPPIRDRRRPTTGSAERQSPAPLAPGAKSSVTLGDSLSYANDPRRPVLVIAQATSSTAVRRRRDVVRLSPSRNGSVPWQASMANPGELGLAYDSGRIFTTLMPDNGTQGSAVKRLRCHDGRARLDDAHRFRSTAWSRGGDERHCLCQ